MIGDAYENQSFAFVSHFNHSRPTLLPPFIRSAAAHFVKLGAFLSKLIKFCITGITLTLNQFVHTRITS
jgi:hypothetical protein